MFWFIVGVVIGAVGASVGWFFIWRNNKTKFNVLLETSAALLTAKNKDGEFIDNN